MTEEEKQAAAVAAQAEADAAKAKADAGDVDHKAEAEKLRKQLGQAEHTIVTLKKKKDDEGTTTPPFEIDIEAIKAEALEAANKGLEQFKLEQTKDTLEDVLNSMSSNPDEREHIRLTYESKIVKSGFSKEAIRNDLTNAQILANRPKYEKTMSEMQEAARSSSGKNTTGSTTGIPNNSANNSLTQEDEANIKKIAIGSGQSEEKVRAKYLQNKLAVR